MACLAAVFSREFWLCSLHPTAADFLPSDPSVGKAGVHAELWCVSLLPCGDDGSLFLFFFFIGSAFFFYVLLFSSFPSFSGESKSVLLHWWESLWIAKPQQYVLYFIQRGERAGLWLEAGCLDRCVTWKPRSLASAFVRSVV